MSKQTSVLIMRHILSLKPREVFYRADLLRYGDEHVVDQKIYRLILAKKIIRLLKGIYIRRQPDGWLPSPEMIGEMRAEMLGRIISEDSDSLTAKICNPDEEFETLTFITTGCSMSFEYQGKTIRFRERTGKKIKLSKTRIGKAINVLWNLGPELTLEETRWFLEKYLHTEERHQMRQRLSGLPIWLLDRLKSILPEYNPIGYNGREPETLAADQYKNYGTGASLSNFRSSFNLRVNQKMKETDEQIVESLLKPIEDLSISQKKLLLEKVFKKYWDERLAAEGMKGRLPLKSNSGFVTKLLIKVANDPQEELEELYLDVQANLIQLRQAVVQGLASERQINKQIDKQNEINATLVEKLSKLDPQKEQAVIVDIQNQIEERENALLDLSEQASDAKSNNDGLRLILREVEEYAWKAYNWKQILRARFKAIKTYEQAKQLLNKSFSINLDSELSKFERVVLDAESKLRLPPPQENSDDDTADLLTKSIPIIERNTWVLERVEEMLKNLENELSKIKT